MKKFRLRILLAFGIMVSLVSCSNDDDSTNEPETETETETGTDGHVFKESLMVGDNLLQEVSIVSARLVDGTTADCYKLVFKSNPVANGPYCPETENDIGGLGVYDGNTNPGFQVMKKALWDAMEADGYDLVDDDGNVVIADPAAGPPPSGGACLEGSPDNDLELTFLIPAEPKMGTSNDVISTVEHIGVSKDGIPLTGDPPSATQSQGGPGGGGAIPSLDPCGGHMDPSGYYHLHFGAEAMNEVLISNDITDVSCTNYEQSETVFIGFAKDGYPIYSTRDADGTLPDDLDECYGHFGTTTDYPDGIYHYHVSSTQAPNLPPCLKGVAVNTRDAFSTN